LSEVEEIQEEDENNNEEEFTGCTRQVHLITGLHQVVISTEDPFEHIDYLMDRALYAIEYLTNKKKEIIDDGIE
jgi:hypothetical protein